MTMLTRRNLIRAGAAGLALPALSRGGLAAEPLKVGFVYLGAIGDYGWTWSHEQGRKALDAADAVFHHDAAQAGQLLFHAGIGGTGAGRGDAGTAGGGVRSAG